MSQPARLSKSETTRWEAWMERHAPLLLFICIIILGCLIVALIVTMFAVTAAPTATEANVFYNHLEAII